MTATVVSQFGKGDMIRFRIEDKTVCEATYKGKTVDRSTISIIKTWMESFSKENPEDFKDFLSYINKDPELFSYGKELLDAEKGKSI